jgi:hypothetical protein
LYWFRTPPYIKVGRTALDEEAIRLLEAQHPDVVFDWAQILREPPQHMPAVEAEKRREQREAREARRRKRARREEEVATPDVGAVDEPEFDDAVPAESDEAAAESSMETSELAEPHPLVGLVGAEGLVRLRARYASLAARITDVQDEVKREALRLEAEGLNPDMWVTENEARQGLETYEANYESLRGQLGRKRRHRRRRPRGQKSV